MYRVVTYEGVKVDAAPRVLAASMSDESIAEKVAEVFAFDHPGRVYWVQDENAAGRWNDLSEWLA